MSVKMMSHQQHQHHHQCTRYFPLFGQDYTIMESEDDMCGPSDAELDSEVEDMDGDDAEQELSVWLDQLNMIQQENGSACDVQKRHSQRVTLTPKMAMESFRISILESGGTQDVDLDAILGELCELETQLSTQQSEINTSIQHSTTTSTTTPPTAATAAWRQHHQQLPPPSSTSSSMAHQLQQYHLSAGPPGHSSVGQQQQQQQPPPPVPPHTTPHTPGKSDSQQQPQSQRDSGFEHIDSQFQSALTELSGLGESLEYGSGDGGGGPGGGGYGGLGGPGGGGGGGCAHGAGPRGVKGRMPHHPGHHQHHAGCGDPADCGANHDYDYPPSERDEACDPSQDTDSAYSDTISLPSSGSHISVTTTSSQNSGSSGSSGISSGVSPTAPGDHAARVKAEKVKLALDKIKEANIKKLFVRCYTLDGSSKSILVDENMTVAQVCDILVVKNHATPSVHWAVVEQLPDLYMERMLEDHDNLVDNILMWSRDSTNKLIFLERPDKYDVFRRPEEYLLGSGGAAELRGKIDDSGRGSLVQEYFSPTSKRVPEMEGMLYLKAEGKKAWKRFYFVLRASGLYYNPKGKSKTSRDLVCLQQCDFVEIYTGLGWKKKYKAPTEHCFALKHPQIQKKAVKYIRYLCADSAMGLHQWITAIRIAKHGHQMLINYESVKNSIATWDCRQMAPHQDLVTLLSQPAPAHMAALAAQKTPQGAKEPPVQTVPPGGRCPHHQRVPSSGGGGGAPVHAHQRMASTGNIGSPRHQGSLSSSAGVAMSSSPAPTSGEEPQHRPTKMTPVLPVTTEVTKQIAEQNKKPNIQRIPPQQHPPRRASLDGPVSSAGSMDLPPPPPPEMMMVPLSAHEAVLSAERMAGAPGTGDFPPPPPAALDQYIRPSQIGAGGPPSSQPGSNRSSTSSAGMGMPPSPASQSPRHSIQQSPRHSVAVRPPVAPPLTPTSAPTTPPPPTPPPHTPPPPPQSTATTIASTPLTMSMPGSPQKHPSTPPGGAGMGVAGPGPGASLQHRRSSSGPSTPTHSGKKPPPPPPPRRSDTTKLSAYAESPTGRYFMADLQRVLTLKQGRSRQFMDDSPAPEFPPAPPPIAPLPQPHYTSVENDDFADLPPPPEELLEGLPGHEKRKPPPPPPKRHLQTQLSFSRGHIS